MSEDGGTRELILEIDHQRFEAGVLLRSEVVLRCPAVFGDSACEADAETQMVVSPGMCTRSILRATSFDCPITSDDVVVADIEPAAFPVPLRDVLNSYVLIRFCGSAVNDDVLHCFD